MKLKALFIVLNTILITGCSSLSEQECQIGDWHGIGYRDGLIGKSLDHVANHQKACSDHQVIINIDEYKKGRIDGLAVYCTPENAYRVGLSGSVYRYVCPKELAPAFLSQYDKGRTFYLQKKHIDKLKSKIERNKKEIDKLQDKISEKEKVLVKEGATAAQRALTLLEIKELQEDIDNKNLHIDELQADYIIEKHKLDRLD